jgi:hypothetical protein
MLNELTLRLFCGIHTAVSDRFGACRVRMLGLENSFLQLLFETNTLTFPPTHPFSGCARVIDVSWMLGDLAGTTWLSPLMLLRRGQPGAV